ncbi:hypothetical protein SAMN05192574_102247 [Mucilaginibacter gossypiicola]|uniref:Uncharacterized protein n=1 Tax=Mucilaginibacter gossypiicola TaxID=551995 RepID=A0A1H8D8D3_9SPHI|nr:hypothetical protein [Mucilaginibacter gossypiicola]SEN03415.1 hypothetical protein SAMN05192574_102247 [Mucilaginibacter gossypiicola]
MEKFEIKVNGPEDVYYFEIEILRSDHCAYQVYENGKLVAVFEPDEEEFLHICDNPGGLDEEVIYEIGLKIEAQII